MRGKSTRRRDRIDSIIEGKGFCWVGSDRGGWDKRTMHAVCKMNPLAFRRVADVLIDKNHMRQLRKH